MGSRKRSCPFCGRMLEKYDDASCGHCGKPADKLIAQAALVGAWEFALVEQVLMPQEHTEYGL